MTKKKTARPNPMLKALQDANATIEKQGEELKSLRDFRSAATNAQTPGRPVATASGPNRADALYPPVCGPLQLVWAAGTYGSCVLGYQCDSFRVFESRQKAADWLRAQARRIEAWDEELTAAG